LKDNDLHNIKSFLKALDQAESEHRKKELLEKLKHLKTKDDALIGLRMFLENNDWNYDEFKGAIKQTTLRIKQNKDNKNKIIAPKIFRYAAILVLLTGIISFSYYFKSRKTIDDFYLKDPGLPNLMSSSYKDKWNKSMKLFKAEKFKEMLSELHRLEIEENNDTLYYYKALSHYNMKNFEKAKYNFLALENKEESVFYYDAEFRLGFSLYKANKIEDSKRQFLKITSDPNHPYYQESLSILDSFFN
jgi:TolA-binding protein